MRTLLIIFATLITSTAAIAACPLDDLRNAANTALAGQERITIKSTARPRTEGGTFYVYFNHPDETWDDDDWRDIDRDSGADVYAIRAELPGEIGRTSYRVTFLNRNNFVIRHINEMYETGISKRGDALVREIYAADYLVCDGSLQILENRKTAATRDAYANAAEAAQNLFFLAPELVDYLKRVKP